MAKIKKRMSGKVLLNNKEVEQISEITIQPLGNELYTISLRLEALEDFIVDPLSLVSGSFDLQYSNSFLPNPQAFRVKIEDSGLQDIDGRFVFTLILSGKRMRSAIIQQDKTVEVITGPMVFVK